MSNNFTPGPWFWDVDGSLYNYIDDGEKQGFDHEVVGVYADQAEDGSFAAIPKIENHADRRLIQVALQIFDALQSVVKSFEDAKIEEQFCAIMGNLIEYVNNGIKTPEPEEAPVEEEVNG